MNAFGYRYKLRSQAMLTDKVVVVVGGGTGIGAATALAFCHAGARVFIGGRRTEQL